MKKCPFVLVAVAICLLLVSCSMEKQNDKDMTESSEAASNDYAGSSSEINADNGNTHDTHIDDESSKFCGEWKANIVTGYSDDGYEYGVENLTLGSDGQAVYKYFKGNWSFQKENSCILLNGKITRDGMSVEVEIILQVLEKDGVTVLHLDDSDDILDEDFYPSAVFVPHDSMS